MSSLAPGLANLDGANCFEKLNVCVHATDLTDRRFFPSW